MLEKRVTVRKINFSLYKIQLFGGSVSSAMQQLMLVIPPSDGTCLSPSGSSLTDPYLVLLLKTSIIINSLKETAISRRLQTHWINNDKQFDYILSSHGSLFAKYPSPLQGQLH